MKKYMPKIRRRCNHSSIIRQNITNAGTWQKNLKKVIQNYVNMVSLTSIII